jgi:hypothetical protein
MEAGNGFPKLILFFLGVLGRESLLVFDRRSSAICG